MSNVPVSTEGRIFAKHVVKDARQREQAGANLLSPGASNWRQALEAFGMAMSKERQPGTCRQSVCHWPRAVACRDGGDERPSSPLK